MDVYDLDALEGISDEPQHPGFEAEYGHQVVLADEDIVVLAGQRIYDTTLLQDPLTDAWIWRSER